MQTDALLAGLNEEQKQAVQGHDGPILVLAGAGSGKTRVLTHRIAWIIASGKCTADEIMAVTFTNKAAGEMRERLEELGIPDVHSGWIGTFHGLGARVLRREAEHLDLKRSFIIYDADDQKRTMKLLLEEYGHPDSSRISPALMLATISRAKNAFLGPTEFALAATKEFEHIAADIYTSYTAFLRENNAVDFDDLLMLPVLLFQAYPMVLDYYKNKFKYILVDEYQDTNRAQYHFLKMLSSGHRNIFVVGDDDQSIYRWRGADLRNILDFKKDYPDAQVFRLEQNYRSTSVILDAAHSVIVNNRNRHEKKLWTERRGGELVKVLQTGDGNREAAVISEMIMQELKRHRRDLRDFAILYRTNAQSRVLEEALRRAVIPYKIVGGLRFYERKEIKDVLAYLRLVVNPLDSISLRRVINFPSRGIGDVSLGRVQQFALDQHIPLFDALRRADDINGLSARVRSALKSFHGFISKYTELKGKITIAELSSALVEETGMLHMYKEEGTEESRSRIDNIRELLNAIYEFAQNRSDATLDTFLEEVALVADVDSLDSSAGAVTLMSVHSAKGLEFPVVFIAGLEDGLFPLLRSAETRDDLEEERRLFYVGTTRAKETLYLSWAKRRRTYKDTVRSKRSRFLAELDSDLVEVKEFDVPAYPETYQRPYRTTRKKRQTDDFEQVMPDYENFSQDGSGDTIPVGAEIRHPSFGVGVVQETSGRGENLKIKVYFKDEGLKTIVVKYVKIDIL